MTLATVVDIERLVSDYLRTHADIVALSTRIVGKTPDSKTTSWVRVTEINAPQVNQPDYLTEFMVQFDCYAGEPGSASGGQPGANALARAVRAVVGTLPGTHALGTVTNVQFLGGPRGVDTDLEPARDYKTITALIWAHA